MFVSTVILLPFLTSVAFPDLLGLARNFWSDISRVLWSQKVGESPASRLPLAQLTCVHCASAHETLFEHFFGTFWYFFWYLGL